jgi:hypothetical protein
MLAEEPLYILLSDSNVIEAGTCRALLACTSMHIHSAACAGHHHRAHTHVGSEDGRQCVQVGWDVNAKTTFGATGREGKPTSQIADYSTSTATSLKALWLCLNHKILTPSISRPRSRTEAGTCSQLMRSTWCPS